MFHFITALLARLSVSRPSTLATTDRSRRAITFIEYALLGVLALAIFVIFRGALSSALSGLMGRISDALGS